MDNEVTIIVVVEYDHSGIKPVTYELLNAARKLADNRKIIALYFTDVEDVDDSSLTHCGADEKAIIKEGFLNE